MRIRGGKLLAREHQFLENIEEETDGAVLEAYLVASYLPLEDRATELLVPFEPEERELVEASLERTKIHAPQRGPRRELVDLATQNARHLLEELRLTGDESPRSRAAARSRSPPPGRASPRYRRAAAYRTRPRRPPARS